MCDSKDVPVRSYMDDPGIQWRTTKPDYTDINKKYLAEKVMNHKADSLEKLVENLVKTWEMESTHKANLEDWQTIDHEKFQIQMNGGRVMNADDNLALGNYNMFLEECPLFDTKKETHSSSLKLFQTVFPEGFAWEVLEVYSGPPKVSFSWRHWATWTGPYRDIQPTGEKMEMYGCCVVTVNDDLKIQKADFYFDPNPIMVKLNKGKCPMAEHCREGASCPN